MRLAEWLVHLSSLRNPTVAAKEYVHSCVAFRDSIMVAHRQGIIQFAIDGSHTRSKRRHLALTCFDGNKKLLVLAAAEATSENSQALALMLHCAGRIAAAEGWDWNDPSIVLTSDRGAAIEVAVRSQFPDASRMYCMQHLLRDCAKKIHRKRTAREAASVWAMQKAPTVREFASALQAACECLPPAAFEFLNSIAPSRWCIYSFQQRGVSLAGVRTSNAAEIFFSMAKQVGLKTMDALGFYAPLSLLVVRQHQMCLANARAYGNDFLVPHASELYRAVQRRCASVISTRLDRTRSLLKRRVSMAPPSNTPWSFRKARALPAPAACFSRLASPASTS